MSTVVKVLLLAMVAIFVASGIVSVAEDLIQRSVQRQIAKRESESSDSKGAKRDAAFKKFRECVRSGETWNNCIEE